MILVFINVGWVLMLIATTIIFGICHPFSPLPKIKSNYYQEETYYHHCEAEIVSEKKPYLFIKEIYDLDINESLTYYQEETKVRVFSLDVDETWNKLQPEGEMMIQFTINFGYININYPPAIVQISYNGEEILSFEDGQAALLKWAANIRQ